MDILFIDDILDSFNKEEYIDRCLNNDIIGLEFHYSSDFANTKVLREFIELIGKKIKISEIDSARLVLVADEMNNNSVEYGSAQGDINIMRVNIKNDAHEVNISVEVEDTGKGKKHRTAQEMEDLKNYRKEHGYEHYTSIRGRGLFMIIINIVDRIYFADSDKGGLIVGIETNIKKI